MQRSVICRSFVAKCISLRNPWDFLAVLFGYAISGERTLEEFYQRLQPFAVPFMALFERDQLPSRAALSRFLAALTQAPVEALRSLLTSRSAQLAPYVRQANRKPAGSSRNLLDCVRHRWDARGRPPTRFTPDR
jgi:hypothetical protein